MKIRCIIVDDEPLSQDVIKKYIAECTMLELVNIYPDAVAANEGLLSNDIQLMFLDINMPKISGIRFVKTLNKPPLVIFTTAYPEYAIEGFEVDALDYLVKPISYERFLKAVNKAIEKISFNKVKRDDDHGFILLKCNKKVYRVNYDEINYIQSLGDYIKVFTADKNLVVHETFKNLLEQLSSQDFIRIHKSFIISLKKIQYIEGNQLRIAGDLIPIGLNYKEDLLKKLNVYK